MRIRTIKPEFWLHEGLCACSEFTRLLAIALLNWSDDEGYFMANPVLIRGQVFPFLDDSKMIPRSLQELSRVGWIRLGKDNSGRDVGCVTNFSKHQRVDKPKPSEIKGSSTFQDDSKMIPRLILDASKEEWKGMEEEQGKGKGVARIASHPEFDEFWNSYPNKTAKAEALKAWTKAKPELSKVLEALQWQKRSQAWTKDSGEFVPHAATYLNQRRFEDERPKPTTNGGNGGVHRTCL